MKIPSTRQGRRSLQLARSGSIPGTQGKAIPGSAPRVIPGQPRSIPGAVPRNMRGQFVKGGVGVSWSGLDVLMANVESRGDSVYEAQKEAMERAKNTAVEYAQQHASWEDRTGDARRGLKGLVIHNDRQRISTLYLGHTEQYGIFLETRWGGKFQIIMPTLRIIGPRLQQRIAERDPLQRGLKR
jgi:hypothetical protein